MVRRLIERFGADHVILGTDYPYDMADDDPLGTIGEIKRLPKADRELVVGGNAVRLLKIKQPKVAAKPKATPTAPAKAAPKVATKVAAPGTAKVTAKATAKVAAKTAPTVKPKRKA
jgi:hypothetical protein